MRVLFCTDTSRSHRSDDSGVAILEACLVILIMTLFTTSLFEFGRALDTYYRYVQVARDATRLGGWLGSIDHTVQCTTIPPSPNGSSRLIATDPGSGASACQGQIAEHLLIHDRASALATIIPERIDPNETRFNTNIQGDLLTFTINLRYRPLVPILLLWDSIPMNIQVTGPVGAVGSGLLISANDSTSLLCLYHVGFCSGGGPKGIGEPPESLENGLRIGLMATSS